MIKPPMPAPRIRPASQHMGSMPRSLGWSGLVHLALFIAMGLGLRVYPESPPTLNVVFVDPGEAAGEAHADAPQPAIGAAYASIELLGKSFDAPSRALTADETQGAAAQTSSAALPREVVVLADQQDTPFTPYLQRWSYRIEQTGDQYAPKSRDGRNLYGSLVMNVVIDGKGRVLDIKLLRPSGEPLLDAGAKRIVELAGPFEPFTEAMLEETDHLHIVRTWNFEPGLSPAPSRP